MFGCLVAVMLSAMLAPSSAQHHSTYNEPSASDLTTAIREATQPVVTFEAKLKPVVEAALGTLTDTIATGYLYDFYGPEGFEREAAAANCL